MQGPRSCKLADATYLKLMQACKATVGKATGPRKRSRWCGRECELSVAALERKGKKNFFYQLKNVTFFALVLDRCSRHFASLPLPFLPQSAINALRVGGAWARPCDREGGPTARPASGVPESNASAGLIGVPVGLGGTKGKYCRSRGSRTASGGANEHRREICGESAQRRARAALSVRRATLPTVHLHRSSVCAS